MDQLKLYDFLRSNLLDEQQRTLTDPARWELEHGEDSEMLLSVLSHDTGFVAFALEVALVVIPGLNPKHPEQIGIDSRNEIIKILYRNLGERDIPQITNEMIRAARSELQEYIRRGSGQ